MRSSIGVIASAKMRIFQQITTYHRVSRNTILVLLHLQRCEFFSKSQQQTDYKLWQKGVIASAKMRIFQQITTLQGIGHVLLGCYCICKDANFSANHNNSLRLALRTKGVIASAKMRIFQQITTVVTVETAPYWCYCICKDANFSANHNYNELCRTDMPGVIAAAKMRIFQQITTLMIKRSMQIWCYCICKDANFSANHNEDEKAKKWL